eukprot:5409322-Prymnesium_polylepis.1
MPTSTPHGPSHMDQATWTKPHGHVCTPALARPRARARIAGCPPTASRVSPSRSTTTAPPQRSARCRTSLSSTSPTTSSAAP